MPDPDTEKSSTNPASSSVIDKISYRRILVPVVFCESSAKAAIYAARLAACFGCPVTLLHVISLQGNPIGQYPLEYTVPDSYVSQHELAESEAKAALRSLADCFAERGIQADLETRVGTPFEEIVNAADQFAADLIVISSRGRTGLGRLLPGNTAERVLERARCPVLVIPDL
jgi:nucleotide-binding universal stress UspA family protein